MVYLPTKLGDLVRANVGFHVPAPWLAYEMGFISRFGAGAVVSTGFVFLVDRLSLDFRHQGYPLETQGCLQN